MTDAINVIIIIIIIIIIIDWYCYRCRQIIDRVS